MYVCVYACVRIIFSLRPPPHQDVNTLVDMLQYTCGDTPVMNGDMEEGGLVSLYQPPGADVPEFALRRVCACVCACMCMFR
jgi:hypothetical protein